MGFASQAISLGLAKALEHDPVALAEHIRRTYPDLPHGFIIGDWSVEYPAVVAPPRDVFPRQAMRDKP